MIMGNHLTSYLEVEIQYGYYRCEVVIIELMKSLRSTQGAN